MKPQIPHTPKSWFFAGYSKDYGNQPTPYTVMNKSFIVYRKKSDNKLVVVGRRCPHMQADLQYGKVVGDHLVCHCHGWKFNSEGTCVQIPLAEDLEIPAFARLPKYPVEERHGLVFIYNGKSADFELPFFNDLNPNDFICSKLKEVHQNTDWYIVTSNAFDLTHFIYLHQRIPYKTPELSSFGEFGRRIVLDYKVLGQSFIDRIIAKYFGGFAQLDYTVWGGNFLLAETNMGGRFKNRMLILVEQKDKESSKSQIFVFGDKKNKSWVGVQFLKLKLWIQSLISQRFFEQEAKTSSGMSMSYKTMNEKDVMVRDIIKWIEEINNDSKKGEPIAVVK